MPDFAIVDSHVHLWDPTRFRMTWLDGNPVLDRPYGLAEYRQHTAGVEIDAMVYLQVEVEPPYALLEAQWVTELAREEPRLQAIVAWAPLEFGEQARAFLDALLAANPLVKGIRRIIQFEPDPTFCLQPRFIRGVQLLAEYGLTFDICIHHGQLKNTARFVEQCPEVNFILDHIGKPDIKNQILDPWRADIATLAALPNVICKISGMVTEADHRRWTVSDLAPYVEHVLEVFGEDRVAYGGDWPVAYQAAEYQRWVENARRFYRLPTG